MRASLSLKINIAIVISLAFIFRLMATDTCLLNPPENTKIEKHAAPPISKVHKKRRRNAEVAARSNSEKYTVAEVYEETPDNEKNLIRADSPVLLSFLYSSLFKTADPQLANQAFDPLRQHLTGKKYLALSILRI
jgi:hypothetical protein